MPPLNFTRAQRALIRTKSSIYVEACPGAGKTQAIVQRFIDRPASDPRRGVGLISFTNAVIDEARTRCSADPALLQVPNFVGTIDSFINRFVVGPVFRSRKGISPSFRDTWATVPGTTVQAHGLRAELDWFSFDAAGTAKFRIKRVPWESRGWLASQEPWKTDALESKASALWLSLVRKGILDAEASRVCLAEYLRGSYRERLAEVLSARFSEVIVDEVQDCSREDVAVLKLLLDSGVRLIMVGDPDQAIYGFRQDTGETQLDTLLDQVPHGERLNGNFRSSPAICRAVDSLRYGGASDDPVGKDKDVDHPVYLLSYTAEHDARQAIGQLLDRLSVDRREMVVLAHHADKARKLAGSAKSPSPKSNKLVRLAMLIHRIQDKESFGPDRARALRLLERYLQELCPDELAALTFDAYLDDRRLTASQFRERCLRLAVGSVPPFSCSPSQFKTYLLSQEESQHVLGWSLEGVRRPDGDVWPIEPDAAAEAFAYSTVHGYKGLQAPAVALVVPKPSRSREEDGVQQWCADEPGEARRVLYVGASRAQELLVIAAHRDVYDPISKVLSKDGVNAHVILGETTG
ncbi:UvrD-helicase domain-containing protein [Rhodococcus sp. W8901]|uniref:UvrD-helicase domain-containing protein n=1 Tax=Rhodococcus sp. W8901 TaxID=2742603 RepID=UPI0015841C85|nr:ATP-dependent helicase [Rhodococcus sp. W8901]QKT12165.1 ATP-dependent helicase [Rhodococcus sp. W8901]